jgi:hypothetical protein
MDFDRNQPIRIQLGRKAEKIPRSWQEEQNKNYWLLKVLYLKGVGVREP